MLSWSSSLDDDNELLNLLMQWWKKEPKNYNGKEHLYHISLWVFLPIKRKHIKDATAALTFAYLYTNIKHFYTDSVSFSPLPSTSPNSVLVPQLCYANQPLPGHWGKKQRLSSYFSLSVAVTECLKTWWISECISE